MPWNTEHFPLKQKVSKKPAVGREKESVAETFPGTKILQSSLL